MGKGMDRAGFQAMPGLLKTGRRRRKLSGSDRNAVAGPPCGDAAPLMAALAEAAPDRLAPRRQLAACGAFGPDPIRPDLTRARMPDLAARLFEAVKDPDLRQRLLVENFRTFFGF